MTRPAWTLSCRARPCRTRPFLPGLIALLALGLTACQGAQAPEPAADSAADAPVGTAPALSDATLEPAAEASAPAAPGSVLARIQERGKLVCGTKVDVPTFGYLNPETNAMEGFDVDVCRAIAAELLGDPQAVEFKEAISKNRIPFLTEGVVDVVASTMTINAERLLEIDFSSVYFVAGQSLLVPADSAVGALADLKGQAVGTVKGSTSEKNLAAASDKDGLNITATLFDTYSEAVAAMDAGRVAAVTTDDIILFGYVKQEPDKWKVVGGQFSAEPYGVGLAKGDAALLAGVNAAIAGMKSSGAWQASYQTWIPAAEIPQPPADDWQAVVAP